MKKISITALALACVFSGGAYAATFGLTPSAVTVSDADAAGQVVTFVATWENSGTVASGLEVDLTFPTTQVSATTTTAGAQSCAVVGGNAVKIIDFDLGGNPLPAKNLCNITVTLNADNGGVAWAAGDTIPLVFANALASAGSTDLTGDLGTHTNGLITISAGPPPDVVVTFTPASGGTVAFGGGAPGDTSNGSIAVGSTGTIGSGTVNNCVISGADAAAFSVVSGDPTTVPPAGSIALEATLGAAALTATLTCDVADSGGASTATWTLTAPAGTTLAAPTLGATPASGTAITLPTSTGTPVSSPIAIAPTAAGDTGGPAATLACSATAGFTVAPASLTFAAGSAAGQNVMVGCTPDTADAAGSVSCTGSDASGAITWSWPVTCPAAVDAPPAPTFIPATSLWSKLALFGVFAALGMLVLGLRRNH